MNARFKLLVALLLLSAVTLAASDWAARVRAVLPPNIVLTDIRQESDHLRIAGLAIDNSDISNLMRAIAKADLGSPELELIQSRDGKRSFILRVKIKL